MNTFSSVLDVSECIAAAGIDFVYWQVVADSDPNVFQGRGVRITSLASWVIPDPASHIWYALNRRQPLPTV